MLPQKCCYFLAPLAEYKARKAAKILALCGHWCTVTVFYHQSNYAFVLSNNYYHATITVSLLRLLINIKLLGLKCHLIVTIIPALVALQFRSQFSTIVCTVKNLSGNIIKYKVKEKI